jgi:hypothetical protein
MPKQHSTTIMPPPSAVGSLHAPPTMLISPICFQCHLLHHFSVNTRSAFLSTAIIHLVRYCFMVFVFLFMYFLFSRCLLNMALSSLLICPLDALWGIYFLPRPLGCGCERYLGFRVEDDEFLAWEFSAFRAEK